MSRELVEQIKQEIAVEYLTDRHLWDMAGDAVSEENLDLITALWELGCNKLDRKMLELLKRY